MDFEANNDQTLIRRKPWERNLKAGKQAMKNGEYDEAERLLKLALTEVAKFGTDDPRAGNICGTLATLCTKQGKVAEAEHFYNEVIQIWEAAFGKDYSGLVDVFDSYAQFLYKQDRKEEGDELRQRSRKVSKRGDDSGSSS